MWIVSSCCDYSDFDFDWDPVPWESRQIHCWASGTQKYGDTFLIPVAEWKEQNPEFVHWFRDVNYHTLGVSRLAWPLTVYTNDLTTTIRNTDFVSEYHVFAPAQQTHIDSDPALWGEKPRQVISFSTDNAVNLVPRCAKQSLETQVYDYQHLVRTNAVIGQAQDIVFISYDEPQADENWARLIDRFPGARRVHGVNGMEHALKAAARLSSTPWFYATFAKTRLHEDWNFSFVPDRWQAPKHYIFNALNASNGLCYGHMGIILYHKEMVLNAPVWEQISGMDFTMSFATESIPLISVYGEFAISPYHAWRTAFREVSKLCQWQLEEPSVETDYRIHVWKTHAHGDNAQWVLLGAQDGAEFFSRNADTEELKKAFRWDWLKDHFRSKYGPDLLP